MFLINKKFLGGLVLVAGLFGVHMSSLEANEVTSVAVEQDSDDAYKKLADLHLPSLTEKMQQEDKEAEEETKQNAENVKNLFKLLNVKFPIVRDVEKMRLVYNFFSEEKDDTKSSSPLSLNSLKDTEMLCGYPGNLGHHVFGEVLDNTYLAFGRIQLQKMLLEPLKKIEHLDHRQAIIKLLVSDNRLLASLKIELAKMKGAEKELLFFWKNLDAAIEQFLSSAYWPDVLFFKEMNKHPFLARSAELLQLFMTLGLAGIAGFHVFINFRSGDFLSGSFWGLYYSFLIGLTGYTDILRRSQINAIHEKMNGVATFTNGIARLGRIVSSHAPLRKLLPVYGLFRDVAHPKTDDSRKFLGILNTETFNTKPNFFSQQGRALVTFKMMSEIKKSLRKSFLALGQLDAYVSIAELYKKYQDHPRVKFCFPKYIKSSKPNFKIEDFWHPLLDPDTVVVNSVELGQDGGPRNMVVTGPNAGGKSTALKAITLDIILAQSLGIAPAKSMWLTPFSQITTYMNIADTVGSESLFQAEMRRAGSLIQAVKQLMGEGFVFVVMDEIFTGTNPKEGEAAAFGVAKKLAGFDNCINIFATHFKALTKLEDVMDGIVENRRVYVIQNPDGSFIFPYKFEKGITEQDIALALLQQQGFDIDILDAAHGIMESRKTEGGPVEAHDGNASEEIEGQSLESEKEELDCVVDEILQEAHEIMEGETA